MILKCFVKIERRVNTSENKHAITIRVTGRRVPTKLLQTER